MVAFQKSPYAIRHFSSGSGIKSGFVKLHRGSKWQSGGSIFGAIARLFTRIIPIAKTATKVAAKTISKASKSKVGQTLKDVAKDTATNVLADVIEGQSLGESASKHVSSAKSEIAKAIRDTKQTKQEPKLTSIFKERVKRKNVKYSVKPKPKRKKKQYEDISDEDEDDD